MGCVAKCGKPQRLRLAVRQHQELHVAVGVVSNADGDILIARRHDHLHQGGLWEFPGGKLEPGENVEQALRRELNEELGIAVEIATPLLTIRHDYPDRRVLLDVWRVDQFSGEPWGGEDQPILWVRPEALPRYDFPAANRPIVAAARLPESYAVVDEASVDPQAHLDRLSKLGEKGLRLIQLRAKRLDAASYRAVAGNAAAFARQRGITLLLNADPELVLQCGAGGVHLSGERLMKLERRPLPESLWVAASCHGLEELRQAERIGVDFAVLSPVLATPSHPRASPLGWSRFAALCEQAKLPVYALGGMEPAYLAEARRRGGQGIAGIRGFCE